MQVFLWIEILTFLMLSLFLLRNAKRKGFTPSLFYFLSYLIFIYFGSIFIHISGLYPAEYSALLLELVRVGLYTKVFVLLIFRLSSMSITTTCIRPSAGTERTGRSASLISILFLLPLAYYVNEYGWIVFSAYASGDLISLVRSDVTYGVSNYWIFSNIFSFYLPILISASFFLGSRKVAYTVLLLNTIVYLSTGQKFPILIAVFHYLLLRWLSGSKQLGIQGLYWGLTVVLILLLLVFLQNVESLHAGELIDIVLIAGEALLWRIFIDPAVSIFYYLEIFPALHEFIGADLKASIPQIAHQSKYGVSNVSGSLNVAPIGNFYARFGGIWVPGLLSGVGFLIFMVAEWILLKRTKGDAALFLSATLYLLVVNLVLSDYMTNLTMYIFSLGFVTLLLLILNTVQVGAKFTKQYNSRIRIEGIPVALQFLLALSGLYHTTSLLRSIQI